MFGSSFEAVGLVVTDLERTLEFYSLLGLDVEHADASEGNIDVTLPGGMRIMFSTEDRMRKFDPGYRPPGGRGRVSLAFRCGSAMEVDALHDAVVEAGFASVLEPFDVFWGHRYATVLDPDGTRIDLFARIPGRT